ncbi:ParA family protein (plasmid) [Streptomyces phaeochromogenes]|uniref:ParA family protein n=1 Tax=Streptomyces TaxID=1883 RepID=UPI002259315A|nr:ParA family protein [Streptomyces sp. NBC_00237]MCX5207498.1 ParA family protein [Streptomyces sp. NBC_00237]WST00518.1 ParA family protein [Streptomyces phaeochromogenes]
MTSDALVEASIETVGHQVTPFPVQEPETKCVVGWKGGIGKTTLAQELAYLDDGVGGDMDWSKGGLSKGWGYNEETRTGAPLIEAFENDRTPRPLRGGPRKLDLIPGHSTFGEFQPSPEVVKTSLIRWAEELKRKITWDTHPDACASTHGALAASRVAVVPVILKTREMASLEHLLQDISDYPLLLVPYMVPKSVPTWHKDELKRLAKKFQVPVGPIVSEYAWVGVRRKRVAICSEPVFKKEEAFVEQMKRVHQAVVRYGN